MKIIDKIALVLIVIGALNWGSVGFFGFDCVAFLFGGQMGTISRIIYALVGVAGLWGITMIFRDDGSGERINQTAGLRPCRLIYSLNRLLSHHIF